MIWVQQVELRYTKASRGAPGSGLRNRVPRALTMISSDAGPYVLERYALDEASDFAPVRVELRSESVIPRREHALTLALRDEGLALNLRWIGGLGQPRRRKTLPPIVLPRGETARLITNGRHSSYSGQWYTETTFNVAFGESLSPDVFTAREPRHVLDLRADLF